MTIQWETRGDRNTVRFRVQATNTMFKFVRTEHFGPLYGQGGYGSEITIGFGRSPKQAIAKVDTYRKRLLRRQRGAVIVKTVNDGGGGVPILKECRLYKDGKLLKSWY